MKKNFLLLLLMTLLPLAGWAADVKIGDYTVSIATQYVALTDADTGVDAPAVNSIKSSDATIGASFVCVLDANGKKVDGKIKATGTYYLMYNFAIENTPKVMKVPFYVFDPETTAIEKEFIYNQDTYEASQDDGVYAEYLKVSPWSYVWDNESYSCWYPTATTPEEKLAQWNAIKDLEYEEGEDWLPKYTHEWEALWSDYPSNKLWEDFPTFGFVNKTETNVVAVYQNGAYLGKIDFSAENTPQYFLASVKNFWPEGEYALPWPGGNTQLPAPRRAAAHPLAQIFNGFDPDYMMFYEVPVLEGSVETATDLSEVEVNVDCNDLPYNGEEQYPTFSGEDFNAVVTIPATATAGEITLVEGVDFTPVYEAAGDDYKSTGTHNFTVNFIGAYAGSKAATYDITKAHVNINLAYIYKTYGEADPVLPANPTADELAAYTNKLGFEIDASTPLQGTDVKADIAKYLVFKRASGDQNQGEDVKEYEYYYDKAANAEECNYTFSFLQTKSLLIIQPKAVTINVTPAYKEYHKTVELKYDANALKAQLIEADKTKASGTPGATDLITSITWEGAGTDAGEAVNADLTGTAPNQTVVFRNQEVGGYPMTATAATVAATGESNYTVTVATPEQGFAIVPTTTADLTVEVPATEANGAVLVDGTWKFVYNGQAQTPDPLVKDGDVELTEGTDYTVSYENNTDAGTAKCKVTLTGSYSSTIKGEATFTIEKANLVVKPQSTNVEVANGGYTILYEDFVSGETAADLYTKNSTPAHAYFSVNPADIKAKKGAEIEQDVYELEIQLPAGVTEITAKNYNVTLGTALLALNNKPTLVVRPAQNQSKVYDGQEPAAAELAIEVFKADGRTEASDAEKAALKILGKPVYTITKAPGVNVGTYALNVTGPTVLQDYNIEYNNGQGRYNQRSYRITHKDVTITPNSKTMVYGSTKFNDDTRLDAVVAGLVSPDDAETLGITNPDFYYVGIANADYDVDNDVWVLRNEQVGTRNINVTVRNLDNGQSYRTLGNYHVRANNPATLTITKADLIITADNKTKAFGTADPEFTVTVSGAKAGDNVSGFYSITGRADEPAATKENVGTDHPIKVEKTEAGTNAANYNVSVVNGTLTITEATYTVKANDQWIAYAGEINPLDVTINLPGNQTLRWRKASVNETAEETAAREANNKKIEDMFGHLEKLDGKGAIGANADAYKWVPVTGGNYVLATGEAGNFTVPATNTQREQTYVNGFCNGYLTVYPLTRIPLDMANLAQVLEDHKGLEGITFVLPERGMTANNWYGWVLPFDVTAEELFGGIWGYGAAETLNAKKSTGNRVSFNLSIGKIAANTPFIAKVATTIAKADMKQIEITGKKIPANVTYYADGKAVNAVSASTDGTVKFIGLYDDKTGFASNEMYLARQTAEDENEFWPGGTNSTGVTLKKSNAYLQLGGDASHAVIFIEEEDGTYTAINGLSVDALEGANADGWYTVNGVKVAAPTQKGLYIMDGKKVLVK